jgi:chromosome partitioning protein
MNGKIIAIANFKGGVGKSTTSLLLGFGLHSRGYKVLLVDLDPQKNLSRCTNAETHSDIKTTYDLFLGRATAAEAIQKLPYFDVIVSDVELSSVEGQLPIAGKLKRIKKFLTPAVKNQYDFIILDCCPTLNILSVNALCAADSIIVPSSASAFSIEGFLDFYNTVNDIKNEENENLTISGVLISMYQSRTMISKDLVASIKSLNEKYGVKTYDSLIRNSIFISESQVHRFNPFEEDPTNIACIDFNNFIDEFLLTNGGN